VIGEWCQAIEESWTTVRQSITACRPQIKAFRPRRTARNLKLTERFGAVPATHGDTGSGTGGSALPALPGL
jgi:hypothetical protein